MTAATTTDLAAFLLARLSDEEATAQAATVDGGDWSSRYAEQPEFHIYGEFGWIVSGPGVETEDSEWGKAVADHIARHDPARVLAEVASKRAIVGMALDIPREGMLDRLLGPTQEAAFAIAVEVAVRHLAAAYADHPDFNESWKV